MILSTEKDLELNIDGYSGKISRLGPNNNLLDCNSRPKQNNWGKLFPFSCLELEESSTAGFRDKKKEESKINTKIDWKVLDFATDEIHQHSHK